MTEEKIETPKKTRKPRAKKAEVVVHSDLIVKGNKKNTIDSLVNSKGFFSDTYGNKIYPTDSKANQDRLKKLKIN